MVKLNAVLSCADSLTPEIAARLTRLEERYESNLQLEFNGTRIDMDSLIGILSVPCRRGSGLTVIADGKDEKDAVLAIRAALQS